MKISISEHFTYGKLLRFVFPSIIMMIFTSIYGVVDGIFVSNFAGETPFKAINLIFPLFIILGALGFMIGTGGTAVVAKTMGEGQIKKANEYFSMLVYITAIGGVILSAIGLIFLRKVAVLLGAEGEILNCCVLYGIVNLISLPFFMLQNVFQSFFVTAEKPKLGLAVTVAAGMTNIVLDALFVAVFDWGLFGAALATALSQFVGGALPILYFASKNSSCLRLGKAKFHGGVFLRTCTNGSSELMSNISASVVTMLYNFQLIKFAGDDGIAAYGVIMYVGFIFVAIFIGFSIGSAPIVSYHFGAENCSELKNMFRKSLTLISITGVVMTITAIAAAYPLSSIFVGYNENLLKMTVRGFSIYAFSYLICGFNIFGSSFFTALNDGLTSALISFLRTLIFQTSSVLIMPMLFELDGIWFSVIAAEILAFAATVLFLAIKKKKYNY